MPARAASVEASTGLRPLEKESRQIEIALLTGCQDRPYAFGLAMALAEKEVNVDIIGGDEVDTPDFHTTGRLRFCNLGGPIRKPAGVTRKLRRLAGYYVRLIRYAAAPQPGIFHILWNNKFELFDRTLLMAYYKMRGKKIAMTAHNVNQARRDSHDSTLNRFTLRIQYQLADHIFVHTRKMKSELVDEFGVSDRAVTIIRHPLNNAFPDTPLTPAEAKLRLGLSPQHKAILFFGRITPYKGLEQLLAAFEGLVAREPDFRLIIAGQPKGGSEDYVAQIKQKIASNFRTGAIVAKLQFIPDSETEVYLKAADVLVLPYKDIFQSGVLFLGYSYGLPVIATDVGSFREEIAEGQTGFLCKPDDPAALAEVIERYFASDLYHNLNRRRQEIRDHTQANHSWSGVAELTRNAYAELLDGYQA
jgi:glycosyltransferase involved in cell wall biosynthesis